MPESGSGPAALSSGVGSGDGGAAGEVRSIYASSSAGALLTRAAQQCTNTFDVVNDENIATMENTTPDVGGFSLFRVRVYLTWSTRT